jgi:hypothetical protein
MKTLNVTNESEVPAGTEFSGTNPFTLVGKAWNEKEGWMKSTKVCNVGNGCLVQVTTQQDDNVAEALEYLPGTFYDFKQNEFKTLIGGE